jgi:hypothetical protein
MNRTHPPSKEIEKKIQIQLIFMERDSGKENLLNNE